MHSYNHLLFRTLMVKLVGNGWGKFWGFEG